MLAELRACFLATPCDDWLYFVQWLREERKSPLINAQNYV